MRIALIDPSLFTWPYDYELAKSLTKLGHEVVIFGKYLPRDERTNYPDYLQEIFYAGLEMGWTRLLPHSVFMGLKGLTHPFSLVRLLHRLRSFKPDIIHFQWVPLPLVDQYFIASFHHIAPTILTVHDSNPFNNNPGSSLQRLSAISIMRRFDHLIVHTEQARQRLIKHRIPSGSLALIPHGILEQTDFSSPPSGDLPLQGGDVTLLLFGKLKPYKGADILLRAVAAMPSASRIRCRVHVAGKAYMDVEPLKKLATKLNIEANIIWDLRHIDDGEIAKLFVNADIIVMPYREIDASGVLMLALSAGRPIVASRIGLFAEILQEGVHGYLAEPEDVGTLATALHKLVDNEDQRLAMGAHVLALKTAMPRWSQIARMTERLYMQARGVELDHLYIRP